MPSCPNFLLGVHKPLLRPSNSGKVPLHVVGTVLNTSCTNTEKAFFIFFIPVPGTREGGGGNYSTKVYMGRLRFEVQLPLPFVCYSHRKGNPFGYLYLTKCISFMCFHNWPVLWIKPAKRTISCHFHSVLNKLIGIQTHDASVRNVLIIGPFK